MKNIAKLFLLTLTLVSAGPLSAQRGGGGKQVNLPKGPMRQVLLKNCTTCHGLDAYAKYGMDRAGWQKMVDSMKAKGAVISDADNTALLDYLVDNFGPDSKPVSVAALPPPTPEEATRAKAILNRACTVCHTLQRVDDNVQTPEQWANTVNEMRGRGSEMTDEEATFLASYLGRANIQK